MKKLSEIINRDFISSVNLKSMCGSIKDYLCSSINVKTRLNRVGYWQVNLIFSALIAVVWLTVVNLWAYYWQEKLEANLLIDMTPYGNGLDFITFGFGGLLGLILFVFIIKRFRDLNFRWVWIPVYVVVFSVLQWFRWDFLCVLMFLLPPFRLLFSKGTEGKNHHGDEPVDLYPMISSKVEPVVDKAFASVLPLLHQATALGLRLLSLAATMVVGFTKFLDERFDLKEKLTPFVRAFVDKIDLTKFGLNTNLVKDEPQDKA